MKVLDPGHVYVIAEYDGGGTQNLRFMKREGPGYPYNEGSHPGTNCQEILRVLIDRVKYLQRQVPCAENEIILGSLRSVLIAFESRAARRHGRELMLPFNQSIEDVKSCPRCGHINCDGHVISPNEIRQWAGSDG